MTPFRKNLEQLRDDHHRQRYNGDLAADVLQRLAHEAGDERADLLAPMRIDQAIAGTRSTWRTMFLPLAATAAIAATIAVGVTLAITHAAATNSMQSPVAVVTPTPDVSKAPSVAVAVTTPKEVPQALPKQSATAVEGVAVANTAVASGETATSGETEVATAESEEFTLVPAVASLIGDNVSMDMSGQGSLDIDLSNLQSNSTNNASKTNTPAARPAQSGSRSSRSTSEERL